MRTVFYFTITLIFLVSCANTKNEVESIDVLKSYSFEEVEKLMQKEPRQIAIFMHTHWCKYCKNMSQTTLKNKKVVDLLMNDYYFISFDGEQKESVVFNGNKFDYLPNGRNDGTHELATTLGTSDGHLAYPTFVFLNSKNEIIFHYASFLDSASLISILKELSK